MKILYGAPASVFVRKPRILLQEKQIAFISDPVNPMLETSAEFKALSPLNKIPIFKDEDFILADSSAICAYLEAKYPQCPLYPSTPADLGKALWFEEYADTALFHAIAPCYYQMILVPLYRNREPDLNQIQQALSEKFPPVANYLEKTLQDKCYLVNSQFTIADVAVMSVLLNMIWTGYPINAAKWPWLARYVTLLSQRPSFASCYYDFLAEQVKLKASRGVALDCN